MALRRALVLELDPIICKKLQDDLPSAGFDPIFCASLGELGGKVAHVRGEIAIVDERAVAGLLVDEHRHDLSVLSRLVPLVLVLDTSKGQFTAEDLGVTAVLPASVLPDGLLAALNHTNR